MARLFFFILLAIVGVLVWRNFKRQLTQQDQAPQPAARKSERVVSCAYCQVHVPESEAVSKDGEYFCGVEHRDAYHRKAS